MKVCIVAEGCYPYVVGGVSSWINSMIKAFPDIEFVVLAIVANRSYRGKFVYELPENVSEVYELYLEDYLKHVVPSEMPVSYEKEALKAQAVCARTYAYRQIQGNSYKEYGAH